MGVKRSAGIACKYGEGRHGYAVRTATDRITHMCEPCADAFDALVDAQNAWQKQIGSLRMNEKPTSDASEHPCLDCLLSHSIIDANEDADNAYEDREEVQEAYDHLESHS